MVQEGKTGLTIRPSTYQFATDLKASDTTWNDIIEAGMVDIANRGYVRNPVTDTSSDPTDSKTIEIDREVFKTAKQRKESFHSRITWDDVTVHGARTLAGEDEDERQGQALSREEVEEIVDERLEQRLAPIEDALAELRENNKSGDDGTDESVCEDRVRELFFELLRESTVPNARTPDLR